MRIELTPGMARVALSRRNLKTLLAKLDGHPPSSAATIMYHSADGAVLFVTAEEDDVHYAHPERATPLPGPVHPETEEAIK